MRAWTYGAAALVCGSAVLAQDARRESVVPLSIPDALGTRSFALYVPITLSPDGKHVAYTVIDPRRRERVSSDEPVRDIAGAPLVVTGGEVWIAALDGSASARISPAGGSSWGNVWSPDGSRVAFISTDGGAAGLWIWDVRKRVARKVPGASTRTFMPIELPAWLPDGRRLVMKLRPARWESERRAAAPRAARVVLRSPARYAAATPTRSGSTSLTVARWLTADLAVVDVITGSVSVIAAGEPVSGFWVSPDGGAVAYTKRRTDAVDPPGLYDIVVRSVSGGSAKILVDGVSHAWGTNVSWSPDGKRLAFHAAGWLFSQGEVGRHSTRAGGCYVVSIDHRASIDHRSSIDHRASIDHRSSAGGINNVCGERWRDVAPGLDAPQWTHDGAALLISTTDTVWRVDAATGAARVLARLPGMVTGISARVARGARRDALVSFTDTNTLEEGLALVGQDSGGTVDVITKGPQKITSSMVATRWLTAVDVGADAAVYPSQSAHSAQELWLARPRSAARQVTKVNANLEKYSFGEGRIIEWLTDDGIPARGALFLPTNYTPGTRYPLIVRAYPRVSGATYLNRFGGYRPVNHVQLFTTRGYAVLYADVPQRAVTPMLDIAKSALPGVNKAIEIGVADPERVGAIGHSHAGYAVLSLIVLTDRFRAAVVENGMGNLLAFANQLFGDGSLEEYAETGQGMMGGSIWDVRERYIENSPIFYLDRVKTPLLITYGAEDPAFAPSIANELFVALRRLGKEVQYAKYPGESHAQWSYEAELDVAGRILDWFDRFLMNALSRPSVAATIR